MSSTQSSDSPPPQSPASDAGPKATIGHTSTCSGQPCITPSHTHHPLSAASLSLDALQNVQRSDVKIVETLKNTKHSAVCKVEILGKPYAMKVHRGQLPDMKHETKAFFLNELSAYRRLKKEGLCKEGSVPDFYGVILNMELKDWPNWELFQQSSRYGLTLPANAILLEYIEDLSPLTMENFTQHLVAHKGKDSPNRMERWLDIVEKLHSAGVTHGDMYPRNMMFVAAKAPDAQDRILVLDLESGYVGNVKGLSWEQSPELRARVEETEMMRDFLECITMDAKNGGNMSKHWWNN